MLDPARAAKIREETKERVRRWRKKQKERKALVERLAPEHDVPDDAGLDEPAQPIMADISPNRPTRRAVTRRKVVVESSDENDQMDIDPPQQDDDSEEFTPPRPIIRFGTPVSN